MAKKIEVLVTLVSAYDDVDGTELTKLLDEYNQSQQEAYITIDDRNEIEIVKIQHLPGEA